MAVPELASLEPAKYRWKKESADSAVVQRLGTGTEAWVGIKSENAKGQYDLYLNTTLRIKTDSSISLRSLKEKIVSALIFIRTQHPEVACTAVWDQPSPPHIRYEPPKNDQEAFEWAEDVVEVKLSHLNGVKFRTKLVEERLGAAQASGPESSKNVAIFLIADAADEGSYLKLEQEVDVLMHFNHIWWDGISARQFVGDILRHVGETWDASKSPPHFSWGDEVQNLSPPILDAMKIDVADLGREFVTVREKFLQIMFKSGSSWGLPVNNNLGVPSTEFYNFSVVQSEAMVKAIKKRIGPQYTISHLGHIATVLALLKFNPIPDDLEDVQLITPLPSNGRRFLRDELANHQFASCQASAVVEFEDLRSWIVDETDEKALKSMLERGCIHIKESYDYWVSKDYLLAMGVSKDNFLSKFLTENPMPVTGSTIPAFITDGLVDRYVPGDIYNSAGEHLISVENCVFLLDTYMPDVFIRMDSWKGATAMTVTYNDGYFSSQDAKRFLTYVAEYMLSFVQ